MFDWIGDFFKELLSLIPKFIYFLNTSLLSLVDFLQLLFRKLAGLDVYYITNDNGEAIATTGDLLTNFIGGILGININNNTSFDNINYSVLSTVFWSFVIFGLIILFISTIVAIIKSHYTYNEKSAKGPLPIVATAGKAVINMVAVPIIVILGLYLSQAILNALDQITSVGSDDLITLYGDDAIQANLMTGINDSQGNETYISYDMFGYTGKIVYGLVGVSGGLPSVQDVSKVAARTQPFSGSMFKVAAYNGNRVRKGQYTTDTGFTGNNSAGGISLFQNHNNDADVLANMVDEAFANFLHLNKYAEMVWDVGDLDCERYLTNFTAVRACAFSKFNVGLVWYYYDLWDYNFVVGFGAVIVCLSIFLNIIMGLMSRLIMALVLFLVMPPLAGLAPLDEGKAFGQWREAFMKQVLMAYGAVVGMNLVLMILPYLNEINFFNIPIVDILVQTLFIIVALITIKAVISTLSGLIGAADANKTGEDMSKEVKATLGKATALTVGAGVAGAKLGMHATAAMGHAAVGTVMGAKNLGQAAFHGIRNLGDRAGARRAEGRARRAERGLQNQENSEKKDKIIQDMARRDLSKFSKDDVFKMAEDKGLGKKDAKALWKAKQGAERNANRESRLLGKTAYKNRADYMRSALAESDKTYKKEYDRMRSAGNNIRLGQERAAIHATLKQKRDDATVRANELRARAQDAGDAGIRRLKLAGQHVARESRYVKDHMYLGTDAAFKGVMGGYKMAGGTIFDKDTMDAFKDTMKAMGPKEKSRDFAAETAANTEKTQRSVEDLQQEMEKLRREIKGGGGKT